MSTVNFTKLFLNNLNNLNNFTYIISKVRKNGAYVNNHREADRGKDDS
jgi:hypothetical protein